MKKKPYVASFLTKNMFRTPMFGLNNMIFPKPEIVLTKAEEQLVIKESSKIAASPSITNTKIIYGNSISS